MLDRDKLHTVFYIDISRIDETDVPAYVEEVAKEFVNKIDDGSVINYFIPVKEGGNRIEFHWPPYIPEEDRKLPSNVVEYIEENNINVKID